MNQKLAELLSQYRRGLITKQEVIDKSLLVMIEAQANVMAMKPSVTQGWLDEMSLINARLLENHFAEIY